MKKEIPSNKALRPTSVPRGALPVEEAWKRYKAIGSVDLPDGSRINLVRPAFGKMLGHKNGETIIRLVPKLPLLLRESVPAFFEPETKPEKTRNVVGYHSRVSKAEIDGRLYYVRFTAQEVRKPSPDQLELKNSALSDVEIIEATIPGVHSGSIDPAKVGSGDLDKKLLSWLASVNPASVSRVRDANGEPLVVWHGGTFSVADGDSKFDSWTHFGTRAAAEERFGGSGVVDGLMGSIEVEFLEDGPEGEGWYYTLDGIDDEVPYGTEEEARAAAEAMQMADNAEAPDASFTPAFLSGRFIDMPDLGTWGLWDVIRNLPDGAKPSRAQIERISDLSRSGRMEDDWNELTRILARKGIAGIRYRNQVEDKGSVSYIAFKGSSIKSATDNDGRFRRGSRSFLSAPAPGQGFFDFGTSGSFGGDPNQLGLDFGGGSGDTAPRPGARPNPNPNRPPDNDRGSDPNLEPAGAGRPGDRGGQGGLRPGGRADRPDGGSLVEGGDGGGAAGGGRLDAGDLLAALGGELFDPGSYGAEPPPTPGLRREGHRGDEKGNS